MTLITLVSCAGCGAARSVTVSGTVAEDTTRGASGPIRIQFYESVGRGDAGPSATPELRLIDTETVAGAGPFEQTLSVHGTELYVVAFLDADQSHSCDDGESWGKAVVALREDEDAATADVDIAPQAHCLSMTTVD
ncbi:MAG TPA: hypothetical protein VHU80_10075 [Polyangiaceae bacterium]|nr:hypothetical protein [Polyangiaceae bacterium]